MVALLIALAALSGCGGAGADEPSSTPANETRESERSDAPRRAECAPNQANCRAATGRIVYVEAVDPDGDGDAHFVLASEDSVTAPGISVIDVKKELRPEPLPGLGDEISAAGPVFRGSYGQKQIEATELNVAPGAE